MKKLMKTLVNVVIKFFTTIWYWIDKKIILPITKVVTFFLGKYDASGKKFEKWLNKTNTLLFLSLFLAVVVFIIIDQKIINYSDSSAEILTGQSVTAIYNREAYVVEGLPETVDITLIGSRANLYIAKQSTSHEVLLDLTGLKEGQHKVEMKYNQASSSIEYKVNPSYATVVIYPKISQAKTMGIDVLNQDALDPKLVINSVNVEDDNVVVKGADYKLKKVATVKALVDINNIAKQEVGQTVLKAVPLKAYDETGNVVDVEIVPSTIDVTLDITSPSKEVPIQVIPDGKVAFGKAISAIDINETKVTVYGTQEVIDTLNYVPVKINVEGLKENREYKVQMPTIVGIKYMSISSLDVAVKLDNVSDRDIENVSVEYRNLGANYIVNAVDKENSKVTVNVKGVKDVIGSITAADITAYLDLSGLGEGSHDVNVLVEGTDSKVEYLSKTTTVKIIIKRK